MKREVARDEFLQKRMERRKKIRKRRLIAFFVILLILALCVGVVLSFTVFFPIERITVSGSKIYSSAELLKAADIKKGDKLFAVNQGKTENKLKAELPFVETVTFKRQLPDTLKITVKDAIEFAVFCVNDKYFTVSSKGWVLEKSRELPEGLLLINLAGVKCKVGSEIEYTGEKQKLLLDNIIKVLESEKINANSINITENFIITLRVEGRFDVDLGTSNYITEKLRHLSGTIAEIPEGKSGKIDLSMWTNDNKKAGFKAEN